MEDDDFPSLGITSTGSIVHVAPPLIVPGSEPDALAQFQDQVSQEALHVKKSKLSKKRTKRSRDGNEQEKEREKGEEDGEEGRKKGREENPDAQKILKKLKKAKDPNASHLEAVGAQMLRCKLCNSMFGTKSSTRVRHFGLQSHLDLLEQALKTGIQTTLDSFSKGIDQRKAKEVKADEKAKAQEHRKRVLLACLQHGVPVDALEGTLRELLEEARETRISIGHSSNLVRDFLEEIVQSHEEALKKELSDQCVSFFADGSPRFAEGVVIGFRWVMPDFSIRQEVVEFNLFEQSLTGENYVSLLLNTLDKFGVSRRAVYSGLTDRASVNGFLERQITPFFPHYVHSFCMAHAFDSLAKQFACPSLSKFLKGWNKIFSKPGYARQEFRNVFGEAVKRKHKVRWNSLLDQVGQLLRLWNRLPGFLETLHKRGYSPKGVQATKTVMAESSNGGDLCCPLVLELCAVSDFGSVLRKTNLFLQGDDFLAPFVFSSLVEALYLGRCVLDKDHPDLIKAKMPNAASVIRVGSNLHHQPNLLWASVRKVVAPVIEKLNKLFKHCEEDPDAKASFKHSKEVFRFAQLFHPFLTLTWLEKKDPKFRLVLETEMRKPEVAKILPAGIQQGMLEEWQGLLTFYSEHKTRNFDPQGLRWFWREATPRFPSWGAAARLFALFQPSSAVAERAFTKWRNQIGDFQQHTLEDKQKLAVQKASSQTLPCINPDLPGRQKKKNEVQE